MGDERPDFETALAGLRAILQERAYLQTVEAIFETAVDAHAHLDELDRAESAAMARVVAANAAALAALDGQPFQLRPAIVAGDPTTCLTVRVGLLRWR